VFELKFGAFLREFGGVVRFAWGEPEVWGQCTSVYECCFGKLGLFLSLSLYVYLCEFGVFLPRMTSKQSFVFPTKLLWFAAFSIQFRETPEL